MDIRVFLEPQQGATYAEQLAVALATEAAGLDGFFRSDHLHSMGDHYRRGVGPTDTWVTLGAIAQATERIRLGSLLTAATFRYPGMLAVTVAEVDAMSGGRVELGLGAGWYEIEHRAYGVPFRASVGERISRLGEQLEIVTGIFKTPRGATFDFSGEYYELANCPAVPKPAQPHLPIIVGGKGPRRTPALAARFADEFNVAFVDADGVAERYGHLARACEQAGRDPGSVVRSVALCAAVGEDEAAVRRRAEAIGRDVDELRAHGVCGTPGEAAEQLARFAAVGVDRLYVQLLDVLDLEHVALIGAELAPLVASLRGTP